MRVLLLLLISSFGLVGCNSGIAFSRITPTNFEGPKDPTTTTSTTTTTTSTTTTTEPDITTSTTTSTSSSSTSTSSTTTTTRTTTTTTTTLTAQQEREQFDYAQTRDMFKQDDYGVNKTSVGFKAYDSNGQSVPNLLPQDLVVTENGVEVKNFTLKGNDVQNDYDVDIVFTLDITGSMDEEINAVKLNIRDFVSKLAVKHVRARLCAVTFKDWTFDYCRKFVEDDPNTPVNENLEWFLDFLSKLDPSGGDQPKENSLGALVDTLKTTAWGPNRQRVVILITDIMFWIMPLDTHIKEAQFAPSYQQVMNAVNTGGAMIFPITPTLPAYSKDYFQYPSVTKMSKGQWFDLRKLEKGTITMDQIFDKIGQSITTNYLLEYNVEDNPGLDPTLPLKDRRIELKVKASSPAKTLQVQSITSNQPNGHPEYKKKFALQPGAKAQTLKVYVNQQLVTSGYALQGDDLVFAKAPAPNAEVVVYYERGKLRDNIKVKSILLKGKVIANVKVWLNGMPAKAGDYAITKTNAGDSVFDLRDPAFDESDPYMIRNKGYLDVLIQYESN